jgi:hypothetical protein
MVSVVEGKPHGSLTDKMQLAIDTIIFMNGGEMCITECKSLVETLKKLPSTLELSSYVAGLEMLVNYRGLVTSSILGADKELMGYLTGSLNSSKAIQKDPVRHLKGKPKKVLELMKKLDVEISKLILDPKAKLPLLDAASNTYEAVLPPSNQEGTYLEIPSDNYELTKPAKDIKGKLRYELMDPGIIAEVTQWLEMVDDIDCDDYFDEEFIDMCKSMLAQQSWMILCIVVMKAKGVTLDHIVECFMLGARKYSDYGWKDRSPDDYLGAAYRHVKEGPNKSDGHLSHWAHLCWNLCALRWFEKRGMIPTNFQK